MQNNFGKVLKNYRKTQKLTLVNLALKSNISFVQISNIERGLCKPSPRTIVKLAKALNVSYDDLFNESLK